MRPVPSDIQRPDYSDHPRGNQSYRFVSWNGAKHRTKIRDNEKWLQSLQCILPQDTPTMTWLPWHISPCLPEDDPDLGSSAAFFSSIKWRAAVCFGCDSVARMKWKMSFTDQHHWFEERLSGTKKLSVSCSFRLCFGSLLMSVMDYKALAECVVSAKVIMN